VPCKCAVDTLYCNGCLNKRIYTDLYSQLRSCARNANLFAVGGTNASRERPVTRGY
jgi:hypothetical protein